MIKQFLVLMLMLVPMTFAQDNITSNTTTISTYSPVVTTVSTDVSDTSIMTNNLGIKVRSLQLQERIELAIFQARTITTKLSSVANISTADKTTVYSTVTELTRLKSLCTKINSTEQFVDIKKQAVTAVSNAREITQRVFTDVQKADIKGKIKQLEIEQIRATREKIKAAIKEFIAEKKNV